MIHLKKILQYGLLLFIDLNFYINCLRAQAFTETPPPSIKKEQRWWNLLHYKIDITPDYQKKFITGTNEITFKALATDSIMQIDLLEPMQISSIKWKQHSLKMQRVDNEKFLLHFPTAINAGETHTIEIAFSGHPNEALNAPYDNGWIWAKDSLGRPWITVACEGSGACIWLPCKEVLYDEPDSGVVMSISVPDSLVALSNGRMMSKIKNGKGKATYTWRVTSPINDYNIIPYIGHYVSWHKNFKGLKGNLDCDYWVLDYNLNKGQKHLQQVDTMLRAFEYWLGPYPFYEDSYKIIEAPFPGMEHQSAVAYGNGFQNGYKGKDFISNSGWGLKWDFIMVHESGHEWFGNSITSSNYSDSWIHEGFTKYLETLYTDFVFGTEAGNDYAIGTWKRIKNDQPILGTNTSDKYYKGSAMLHMIRQVVGDASFRGLMKELSKTFYHQTVNTKQVLAVFNQYLQKNYNKIFEQYLQTTQIPKLEYSFDKNNIKYRWTNCVEGFDMPLKISIDGKHFQFIYPTTNWQSISNTSGANKLVVDRNFYITTGETGNK